MHLTAIVRTTSCGYGLTLQIKRVMKLTAIILLTACLAASAGGSAQVTLSEKNVPLSVVFKKIQQQTGFEFLFPSDLVQKAGNVSVEVKNANLEEAIKATLQGTNLTFAVNERTVVIKEKKPTKVTEIADLPPPIDVKGRVVNEKGEPVEGVSITVKGSKKGTTTNANGEFTLTGINENATLSFSSTNMESFEIKVNGKTDLSISLKTKVTALGDVQVQVNTGYQKISKERFVGSYSQLDSAAYDRRTGMDIISRLDGTVTSVLFDKKRSNNDELTNLQIRGLSTLNSSRIPLIIVDDFPFTQNLDNINPNDVLTVTVLKDAAATSIWGARAGNGVIVITTKKGKYNQSLKVSVSSNITIKEKPNLYYYPQMSVSDFIGMEDFLFNKGFYDADLNNTNSRPVISPVVELFVKRRSGSISAADSATQIDAFREMDLRRDLNKYAYRNAISQQHYINVSGGNSIINYSLSGGYNHSLNGTQHSKGDEQFTVNSNVQLRPVKSFEITTNIGFSQSTQKSSEFFLPVRLYPYAQLADADGNPLAVPLNYRLNYLDTVGSGKLLDGRFRPLEEPGIRDYKNVSRFVSLAFGMSYKFTNWLDASVKYQFSNQFGNASTYNSLRTYYTRNLINQFTNLTQTNPSLRYPVPVGGIFDKTYNESTYQSVRAQLNFNRTLSIKHTINAMIAAEASDLVSSGATSSRFYNYSKENGSYQPIVDYLTVFPQFGGNSGTVPNGTGIGQALYNRFVSFVGNVSYTYNRLYTLYISGRKDGSNVFGVNTNKRWKPLWSAGTSWNISGEKFYGIKWMPSLRIRVSYGYAGNPGTATGLPTIVYYQVPAYLTNLPMADLGNAPNPDLKWEKVGIINAALEFGLFNNRLSGSFDFWQKKSTDLISTVPMPLASGVLLYTANTANLKGTGFELSLNARIIEGKKFKWQTNFGLSYAKTIVTKLLIGIGTGYSTKDFINYSLNATQGRIINGISSYRWAGLDPLTGDPRGYFNKQISTNYNAILNDSISNQVFHGSAVPLYFGFIGNSFSWKNFTISANISYRLNFYFRKPTINYSQLTTAWTGHSDYALRWQKPGDEQFTNIPSFTYPTNYNRDQFFQYSEINVLRGDNIRLQDIRVQYNFNFKKLPFKALSAFVYANNLNVILWRKNKSKLDPDFIGASNLLSAPTPKTLAGGVNLSF